MQPYNNNTQEGDKGLFTFYRQQADLQKLAQAKLSPQDLNQVLSQAIKNKVVPKVDEIKQEKQYKLVFNQRHTQKLYEISGQKKPFSNKSIQIKNKKSVIHDQEGIKSRNQMVISEKRSVQKPQQNRKKQSIDGSQPFSKYYSQLDSIKRRKKIYAAQTSPLSQRASYPTATTMNKQNNHKTGIQNQQVKHPQHHLQFKKNSQNHLQFKKLTLQLNKFQGLNQSIKNFVPFNLKKQISALKSYRKEKLMAVVQNQLYDEEEGTIGKIVIHNGNTIVREDSKNQNVFKQKKKVKVKISKNKRYSKSKHIQNEINSQHLRKNENKSLNLRRNKLLLPQLTNRSKQNKFNSISVQLLRSFELKNECQMKELQQQEQTIRNVNQKLRNEMRKNKNISQQLKHFISLRHEKQYLEQDQYYLNQVYLRQQNSSLQNYKFRQFKFKKQKVAFCKKDQDPRNHGKALRSNIFSMEREDKYQINSKMEKKKKQIIQSLMQNLNLK